MINETIERLQRASVGTQHLGSRYARLLKRLWRKADREQSPPEPDETNMETSNTAPKDFIDNNQHNSQATPGYGDLTNSAAAIPLYDFNWLDLDAVGQFAMDENMFSASHMPDVEAMWLGFGVESPEMNLTEDSDSIGQTGGYMFF